MKVGEILRTLADQIDAHQATKQAERKVMQTQQAGIEAAAVVHQADQAGMGQIDLAPGPEEVHVSNDDGTDCDTMVPPLQQEHELLKAAGGVDNEVDAFAHGADDDDDDDNELAAMIKMAGIGEPEQSLNVADQIGPVSINPKKNAIQMHFSSNNIK